MTGEAVTWRVAVDTYNITIKAICFPLNKINEESLSTIGKKKKKNDIRDKFKWDWNNLDKQRNQKENVSL